MEKTYIEELKNVIVIRGIYIGMRLLGNLCSHTGNLRFEILLKCGLFVNLNPSMIQRRMQYDPVQRCI